MLIAVLAVVLTAGSLAYVPDHAVALRAAIAVSGIFIAGLAALGGGAGLTRGLRTICRSAGQSLGPQLEQASDSRWQIEESASRYRDLLDMQGDFILRRNPSGELVFANAAYLRTFGLPASLKNARQFSPVVIRTELGPRDGSHNEQSVRKFSQLVKTARGERWIAWQETRIASGAGGYETLQTGRDVTDERRTSQDLREVRDQAEAANRAKSRFLASMSHEIRTPMNGILGMSSLLRDTQLTADQSSYVRAIDQSARALLALIDEILDFSKIEAGKVELCSAPFSPAACVQGAVDLLLPRASAKGLTLGFGTARDVPAVVLGDETRIRQIVLNLLSNAVKFTVKGRVDVVIYPLRQRQVTGSKVSLAIAVRDTGVGLSAEAMRRIFLEFEQAGSGTERSGGTGLGLPISKRLARAMGGDITVDGAPGQGSTFTAVLDVERFDGELPAAIVPSHTASLPPAAAPVSTVPAQTTDQRLHVLIAEDNEINALLARRVIEMAGGTATVVTNGRAAISVATAALSSSAPRFDLILMDVFMPEIDGLEATRAIKAAYREKLLSGLSAPPVVALTANAFAEDRGRCLEAGMDDYLAKPFDACDLRRLLARWVPNKTNPAPIPIPATLPVSNPAA